MYHAILTDSQYEALHDVNEKHNFFFNIDRPRLCEPEQCAICFELDDDRYACKLACLRTMPSQYETVLRDFGGNLRPSLGTEAFVQA